MHQATSSAVLLDEQLQLKNVQDGIDRRRRLRHFALVLALVVLAVAVSSLLARLSTNTL
ncbi:MAG: hypothetical protein ABI972_23960 [Acidobacteriota bacterium]